MADEVLTKKPLPTLAEWLDQEPKCAGYYEYVETNIDLQRLAELTDQPEAASALRITMTLGVAIAEACRIETDTHGREAVETMIKMARCIGWAAAGPAISILRDDTPLRKVEKLLLEEVRYGMRQFFTSAIEQQKARATEAQAMN